MTQRPDVGERARLGRLRGAWLAAGVALCTGLALAASGCSTLETPETRDIVSVIPWTAPEERTYKLYDDGDLIGETTLAVDEGEGGTYVLRQRSSDGKGNVDEAEVEVDAESLKPLRGSHAITDADRREVAVSTYESIDTGECDSGIVVRIEEQVFEPPDETTPEVPRRAPLCVPEHAYDNNSSLFLWRTIAFEEGFQAHYKTVLTGTRRTQTVRIEVLDRVSETPLGEGEAWVVDIAADGKTQRAYFSTDDDHRLLVYQNGNFTFELAE